MTKEDKKKSVEKEKMDTDEKEAKNKEEEKVEIDPEDVTLKEYEMVMNENTIGVESDVLQLALAARKLNKFRGRVTQKVLKKICEVHVPPFHLPVLEKLRQYAADPKAPAPTQPSIPPMPSPADGGEGDKVFIPENTVFAYLVIAGDFVVAKKWAWVLYIANILLEYIKQNDRRTMDHLTAVTWQYLSLAVTKLGRLPHIRSALQEAFRTSVLRQNRPCQAVLLNLILQNYLYEDKYTEAEKFIARTNFPDKAETPQVARFQFYSGRINLVQLQYSDALWQFKQAMRKAPTADGVALFFRFQVIINYVMCQLLLSEIPEMALFRTPGLKTQLKPYYELCVVSQRGNIKDFAACFKKHEAVFQRDKMDLLVQRLRTTVLKTGLRRINLAYSRMPLATICERLGMNSVEDTQWVVAKAIRDGVIEGKLQHDTKMMISSEVQDVYRTNEPSKQLQERTDFLMDVYSDAMKAMRYPENFEDEEDKKEDEVDEKEEDKKTSEDKKPEKEKKK